MTQSTHPEASKVNLIAITLLSLLATTSQTPADLDPPKVPKDTFQPNPSWKPLGTSLWFDAKNHRVILRAKVVLRDGPLEHLLCLNGTKEHEAILATGAAPKSIHAALLLTGAEPGHPVRFLPKFEPPTGTAMKIELEWNTDGKSLSADARNWVFDERKKKVLETDWVFAGSTIVEHPFTKKPYYTAEDGDLITVANFANAILDLPFASAATDAERSYVARTEAIPPLGTWVSMIFSPRKPTKLRSEEPKTPG